MAIDPVSISGLGGAPGAAGTAARPVGAGGFGSMVEQLVSSIESTNNQANAAIDGMMDKTADVHDAMIALQRSELALQLAVQVRNKLVQAYQDVMRMPI
jgi:flagellar hook-basal body complex protein FliE